jgi:hypothetical protein
LLSSWDACPSSYQSFTSSHTPKVVLPPATPFHRTLQHTSLKF